MNNVIINPEIVKRLEERFNMNLNEVNPTQMTLYNRNNFDKCPYTNVKIKIKKRGSSYFYLVDELKNMVITGRKLGESIKLNTVLFLYPKP
jgi:hypothetical protein